MPYELNHQKGYQLSFGRSASVGALKISVMAVCVRFHTVKRHSTKLNKRTTSSSSSLHRPEGGVNSIWRRERVREAMMQIQKINV